MKLYNFFIGLAVAAVSSVAVSCSDDFDRPPVIVPEATIEVNTSILELKEQYWQGTGSYMTEIGLTGSGDHIIIGGRVVSNDEKGNIYQRIVIEDETAAIPVRVYSSELYETYHYGQEVRIDVTGLLIGTYNGWLMIGVDYNGGIGGMEKEVMAARAQVNGLPDAREITDYTVTIPDMNAVTSSNETEFMTWQSRFITLEDVSFVDAGKVTFGDNSSNAYVTRYITDANGNRMAVNTSNKCKFSSTVLPTGTGTVKAILSYFRSDWQLVISDPANDCIGFDATENPDSPDDPDTPVSGTIFSESFASGIGSFTVETPTSPGFDVWKHDSKYKYMIATAYVSADKSNHASDSWLISPVISLKDTKTAFLSFEQAINFFSSVDKAKTEATVAVREAGSETWTTLTIPSYPKTMSWDLINSGDIDLAAFVGKDIQVGFHYTSTDTKAGTWELKDVVVKTEGTATPDTPDTPVTGNLKFRKTGQIVSGHKYVLAVDGKVGSVIGQTLSYGRLALADPVAVDGDVITTLAENAIVLTQTDKGYTMTDTYGRYLSMDGKNFSSFQLYAAPAEGSYWTIVCSNSDTVSISNVLCPGYYAVKSGTFTNIAPSDIEKYPAFTYPVLYEMVTE